MALLVVHQRRPGGSQSEEIDPAELRTTRTVGEPERPAWWALTRTTTMRLDAVQVGGKARGTVVGQSLSINEPHPVPRQ
jgi:hypothetical protein